MRLSSAAQFFCGTLLVLIIIGLYAAGLYPYRFLPPNNAVATSSGVRFGPVGIAYSSGLITQPDASGLTLDFEIATAWVPSHSVPRILSFADQGGRERFMVGQWKESLVLRRYDLGYPAGEIPEVSTGSLKGLKEGARITVVSGPKEGKLYVNNVLVKTSPTLAQLHYLVRDGVRLIVANGPAGDQPWRGTVSSLSLFGSSHFDKAAVQASLATSGAPRPPLFAYQAQGYQPPSHYNRLIVPKRFRTVTVQFLAPIWSDFRRDSSYYTDIVVNIAGLIPFGLAAFLLLGCIGMQPAPAFAVTLLSGFLISLSIETLQILLPTRTSQMSDLIFNTLGTMAGAAAPYFYISLRRVYPRESSAS